MQPAQFLVGHSWGLLPSKVILKENVVTRDRRGKLLEVFGQTSVLEILQLYGTVAVGIEKVGQK